MIDKKQKANFILQGLFVGFLCGIFCCWAVFNFYYEPKILDIVSRLALLKSH